MCSYYNTSFLKKDRSYRNKSDIRLHDGDLEHCLMGEKNRCSYDFLLILYSVIPGTVLRFMYVFVIYYNQQSINLFLALCDSQLVCTENVRYLQEVFALYKY